MLDSKANRHSTRRDIVMMGILALGTGACSLTDENRTPLATTAAGTIPFIPPAYRLNEFRYQPDGRFPQTSDSIRIGNSHIEFLNFSDFALDLQTAQDYFNFLNQLPQYLPEIDIKVSDKDLKFRIGLRPNIARRIYLVKPSDPLPPWWINMPTSIKGVTRTLVRNDELEEAVTLVRFYPSTIIRQGNITTFTDTGQEKEWRFMTEACQSTVQLMGHPDQDNIIAQEILCHTLGLAALVRSVGGTFESFITLTRTLEIRPFSLPVFLTDKLQPSLFNRVPAGKVTY